MKDIVIPRGEFIKEHKNLSNLLLKAGKEGAKQKKELKDVMGNGKPSAKFMKDVMKAYRGSGMCQSRTGASPARPPPGPALPRPLAEVRRILEHPEPNDIPLTLLERFMYERAEAIRLTRRHYNEPYNYPSIDITFDDPTEGSGRGGSREKTAEEWQREIDERMAKMLEDDEAERRARQPPDYPTRLYQRALEKYNRQRLSTKRKQKRIGRNLAPVEEGEGEGSGIRFSRARVAPADVEARFNENLANPRLIDATLPEMRAMAEFNHPGGEARYEAMLGLRNAMRVERIRVARERARVAREWVARQQGQEPRGAPGVIEMDIPSDPTDGSGMYGGARPGMLSDEDLLMMAVDDKDLKKLRRARNADLAKMRRGG